MLKKIIEPDEETNWRCSCGTLNSSEDKLCDCGEKQEEDNVEISIEKSTFKKPKRMVPY